MKKLLKRMRAALDLSTRYLEELAPRPKPEGLTDLTTECDEILEEIKKLPTLRTGDVDALSEAVHKAKLSNTKRMKALRALKVAQVFDGGYRKNRKDTI